MISNAVGILFCNKLVNVLFYFDINLLILLIQRRKIVWNGNWEGLKNFHPVIFMLQ